MKNLLNRLFTTFLTITMTILIGFISAQETFAQRYLTEIRPSNEIKGIVQFADNLSEFLELAEKAESGARTDLVYIKMGDAAKKVKEGTSNFRSNLKGLVTIFKNKDQWNDALDSQFNELLANRKSKGFFQRNGARKVLTDADAAINSIAAEVDAIVANLKAQRVSTVTNNSIFMRTAFAPNTSARKFKLKCVVLGIAIFGAELTKATKTAENLDGFFDKSCGAGASTAT